MPNIRTRWVVAALISLFFGVVATIVLLRMNNAISGAMALLMLVGSAGLYVGFGILFAVYRLVRKLE